MFRLFENMVDPYVAYTEVDTPPRRLWPFLWGFSKPFRKVFLATAIMSVIVAVVEIWLISYMGRVVDMLSGATEYLMPNSILVGISWQTDLEADEDHHSRFRDYTMLESGNPDTQAQYQPGQASSHLSFIRDDVIPFVEGNYRAKGGERAYFGYSLGGAFGAYALFAEPETFSHYILGSPAMGQRTLDYLDQLKTEKDSDQQNLNVNVFVSIGELEERRMETTREFASILERRSDVGLALTGLEIIKGSDHGTAFPETAIRGIRWLSQLSGE